MLLLIFIERLVVTMTIKEYLAQEIADGFADLQAMVEVKHGDGDTVGFMSLEDMLDSEAEYLDMEYTSVDKLDDGSYEITIE